MKRKHAELIKQWADDDSLAVQMKDEKGVWFDCEEPTFHTDFEYRIKPTKPSIDWSHVADEYKWLAIDGDGRAALHMVEPKKNNYYWNRESSSINAESHKSFNRGTCDWKDSLVQRPEGE